MRKTLILLFIFHLVVIALHSCECKDHPKRCHSVNTLSLTVLDNADSIAKPVEQNAVLGKAALLRLNITGKSETCFRPGSMSFINSAYAFSKECTTDVYRDKIIWVSLISNKDYDSSHKAGAALNDLFTVPFADKISLKYDDAFDIYSLRAPEDTGTHVFTVRLHLEDGRILETSTAPVKLLK